MITTSSPMRFSSWMVRVRKKMIIPAGQPLAGVETGPGVNGGALRPPIAAHRVWLWLLLAGLTLLVACSSLRLAYSQGPTLVYWWLDGYADFDRAQKPQVKAAVDQWFAWHRPNQLPRYRLWLRQTEQRMAGEPSGEQLCRALDTLEDFRDQALAPLAEPVATLARGLQPAQWSAIERQFAKKNAEWQDEHMQRDLPSRWEAATDRSIDHVERFYGRLSRAQKTWLASRVRASPWRPENDLSERQHKQHDTLATLRTLAQPGLPAAQAQVLAAGWLHRMGQPMDTAHGQAREAARHYLCDMAADFHRQATPEQRHHLSTTLQGWQADIESFIVPVLAGS
jgi:hypothetical protein